MIRIDWVQLFELPHKSETTHVRLIVPVWLQPTIPVKSSDWDTISAAPGVQLSDA